LLALYNLIEWNSFWFFYFWFFNFWFFAFVFGEEGGGEADTVIEGGGEGGILREETVVGFVTTGEILTEGNFVEGGITEGGIEKETS
jgi:hypothetical protein